MKYIAYYLPQFHRVKENDAWWGEGFTEWTNVRKAKPLFKGHNQPRVPLNYNYYDLTDIDTLKWQSELAQQYDIYGFCFYHYWFNGKLLLERPAEILLSNKEIEMKFCFSWANENWTNGWVSDNSKILISHDNNDEHDWDEHYLYLSKFFNDNRYIKKDGKPMIIIYYPNILSKYDKMIERWRFLAKKDGFSDLLVIYQHARYHFAENVSHNAFDYGIEFMPGFYDWSKVSKNRLKFSNLKIKVSAFLQRKFGVHLQLSKKNKVEDKDFDAAWQWYLNKYRPKGKMIPGAFVDWDNTPRKGLRGSIYGNSNPEKFERYLYELSQKVDKEYDLDYIFIFSWNEWAEGGYLEPDTKNGYKYLEIIRRVNNSKGDQ